MENKQTPATTAGLIISLILIVLSLVLYFTDLYTSQWSQYIGFAILLGGILWSVYNHGKERDNTAPFGSLFGFGFKVAAVVTCLMIVYTILSGYIFPEVKEKIIATATEQALKQPGANQEQVEKGMEMFSNNYNLFIILGILFWYLVTGAIASLIGAAVTKKKPQSVQFDNI